MGIIYRFNSEFNLTFTGTVKKVYKFYILHYFKLGLPIDRPLFFQGANVYVKNLYEDVYGMALYICYSSPEEVQKDVATLNRNSHILEN